MKQVFFPTSDLFKGVGLVLLAILSPLKFASAQVVYLPDGLRQHNLTRYNASLINPVYSFDWNQPNALSAWARWQWSTPDGDPTTYFIQYSQMLGHDATVGGGYFQNNTGTLIRRGGVANYSHALFFRDNFKMVFGVNLFGFSEELTDVNFPTLIPLTPEQLSGDPNFILYLTPGVRADIGDLSLAVALENALDYNFSQDERRSAARLFSVMGSYDYQLGGSEDSPTYLRPILYFRSDPTYDSQYGANLLFAHRYFWIQGGYNSYYGASAGIGATVFDRFSFGATMEFGTDELIRDQRQTVEFQVAYRIGKLKRPQPPQETEEEEIEEEVVPEGPTEEEIAAAKAAEEERRRILLAKQDSILNARLAEQRRLDSIAQANKKVEYRADEKFEEVATMDGLKPGFYLIANVFGTQLYYEKFMNSLQKRGLHPQSFKRRLNGYNYVYLKRFDTLEEIREARDSKFYGKYSGPTWIFRVKAE